MKKFDEEEEKLLKKYPNLWIIQMSFKYIINYIKTNWKYLKYQNTIDYMRKINGNVIK